MRELDYALAILLALVLAGFMTGGHISLRLVFGFVTLLTIVGCVGVLAHRRL